MILSRIYKSDLLPDINDTLCRFCQHCLKNNNTSCKQFYYTIKDSVNEFFECPFGFMCYTTQKYIYISFVLKSNTRNFKFRKNKVFKLLGSYETYSEFSEADIKKIVKTTEEIKEKNEIMEDTFHDINTMIGSIGNSLTTYRREDLDDSILTLEKNHKILRGIMGLMDLRLRYQDLLLGEDNHQSLYDNLNLHSILFFLYKNLEYKAIKRDLKLKFTVRPMEGYFWVRTNADIVLALYLFIENAIKYSTKRKIDIILQTQNDDVILCIKNHAENLECYDIEKLAERNYRGPNSKNIKGSGQGLFIAKQILERLGHDFQINHSLGIFSITMTIKKSLIDIDEFVGATTA